MVMNILKRINNITYDINLAFDAKLQPIAEKIAGQEFADKPAPRTGYRWLRGDLKLLLPAIHATAKALVGMDNPADALLQWTNIILGQYDNWSHMGLASGKDHKVEVKLEDPHHLKWRKVNFDFISYSGLFSKGLAMIGIGIARRDGGLLTTGILLSTGSGLLALRAPIDHLLKKGKIEDRVNQTFLTGYNKTTLGHIFKPRKLYLKMIERRHLKTIQRNNIKIHKLQIKLSKTKRISAKNRTTKHIEQLQLSNITLNDYIHRLSPDKIHVNTVGLANVFLTVQLYALAGTGINLMAHGAYDIAHGNTGYLAGGSGKAIDGIGFSFAARDYFEANIKNIPRINHAIKGLEHHVPRYQKKVVTPKPEKEKAL